MAILLRANFHHTFSRYLILVYYFLSGFLYSMTHWDRIGKSYYRERERGITGRRVQLGASSSSSEDWREWRPAALVYFLFLVYILGIHTHWAYRGYMRSMSLSSSSRSFFFFFFFLSHFAQASVDRASEQAIPCTGTFCMIPPFSVCYPRLRVSL